MSYSSFDNPNEVHADINRDSGSSKSIDNLSRFITELYNKCALLYDSSGLQVIHILCL